MAEKSIFETLYPINVNEYVEKKNGLSYLTWSYAVAETKKKYPDMTYEIWRDSEGRPYIYDEHTGYMVFTSVTIEGIKHEMWLPVMDGANKSMKAEPYTYKTKYGEKTVEQATMFDINKTIMRCLVKNLAMFGLGLYIYAGEDLPEDEQEKIEINPEKAQKKVDKYLDKSKIDKSTEKKIVEEMKRTGQEEKNFLAFYKIEKWADLEVGQAEKLLEQLATKPNKE